MTTLATAEPDTVPHEPAGDRCGLGRTTNAVAGERYGEINEEAPGAGADQKCAEYDEQHDVRCADMQRDTENAIAGHEQRVDEFLEANGRTIEEACEIVRIEGVEDEEGRDDDHRPADRAPRYLQYNKHQKAADDQVGRFLFPVTQMEGGDVVDRPDLHEDDIADEDEVDGKARPAQYVARITLTNRLPGRFPEQREHADGEDEHRAQMHGAK